MKEQGIQHNEELPLLAVSAVGLALSPPAVALALALPALKQRRPREYRYGLVVAGACAGLLLFPLIGEVKHAWAAVGEVGAISAPSRAFHAAWPHVWRWWLLALPWAPLLKFALEVARPTTIEEQAEHQERRREQRLARDARRAGERAESVAQSPDAAVFPGAEPALVLGARAAGERLLPEDRKGRVGLPLEWLRRHSLVIGPSGSGKTETLFRLAYGAAAAGGWPVYYLDAKGDERGMERFRRVMGSLGRAVHVFPDVGLDGFRGDARAIYNRLLELIAYSTDGDGAYYRDVAKRLLWLACSAPEGPPRSSAELLRRLRPAELRSLAAASAQGALDALGQRELSGVYLRYEAFFGALEGKVDGGFSFEDAEAAYVLLDGLSLKEETSSLARFLIEDFGHFAARRKRRDRPALLIVDEFSAIADDAPLVDLVERVRAYNIGVVLAPQVEAGMGGQELAERVLQNTETVFLHGLKRPEGIVALAGTQREIETSLQHERGVATGLGSGRAQHVFKVDPNEVRALEPGSCFVIRRGRAARIRVARAPAEGTFATPPAPTLARPLPATPTPDSTRPPRELRL
jgi:hypothetical protein